MQRSDLELVLAVRDHGSLSAEGETVCDRARVLLQGFTTLEAELQERKAEPTGLIRLVATFGFGRLWLGPTLASFQARCPRIEIQLQLTGQLPDLAGGFDGAVWLWSIQGRQAAQWVSRRRARNQRALGNYAAGGLAGRTTRLTPSAVSAVPTTVVRVMVSPNSGHAINAVVGGTR